MPVFMVKAVSQIRLKSSQKKFDFNISFKELYKIYQEINYKSICFGYLLLRKKPPHNLMA